MDVFDLVKRDLDDRNSLGWAQHHQPLTSDLKRDWEVELYQELLDAVIYLRAKLAQRG